MNFQEDTPTLGIIPTSDGTENPSCEVLTLFEKETNPYRFFLDFLTENDIKGFDQESDNNEKRFIRDFRNFLNMNNNKEKYSPMLTTAIQREVFEFLKKFQNDEVQKSLVEIFSLKDVQNSFKSDLIVALRSNFSKSPTIRLIKLLGLSSHFNVDEILVPLLKEEKLEELDEILDCNEMHRKPLIKILDEVVGNKTLIPGLNGKKFVVREKVKGVLHIGLRLMKKYSIPSNFCPNLIFRQKSGRLRFLFINYYKEKEITLQSFLLFVKDLAIDNDTLKKEALQLFVKNGDIRCAQWFLREVRVQLSDIPRMLRNYDINSGNQGLSFANVDHLRNQTYYQLNLPSNSIKLITSNIEFDSAIEHLSSCNVISYDAEWKPVRLYDDVVKLSLIQMASKERIYIFDMISLPRVLSDYQWNKLGELFSKDDISKLIYSYSPEEEKENFRGTNKLLEEHVMKMANVTDLRAVEDELKESHPSIFSYKTVELKGLCELVYMCFGKPLDKIEQCSYWTVRPLSSGQLTYAALDAYCLLEIFDYLNEKARQMKIDCKYLNPPKISDESNL